MTYDRWLPGAGAIYRITTDLASSRSQLRGNTSGAAFDLIRMRQAGLIGTRVVTNYVYLNYRGRIAEVPEFLVDGDFFRVFDLEVITGDRESALSPGQIAISEAVALKHFGRLDVVGRNLVHRDTGYQVPYLPKDLSQARSYRVGAVFRTPPANSSIPFNIVRRLTPDRMALYEPNWSEWGRREHQTFFRLSSPQAAKALDAQLDAIVDSSGRFSQEEYLPGNLPRHKYVQVRVNGWAGAHLADRKVAATVAAALTLGGLAFSVALLNYINLTIAQATTRIREIAVRKAFGAGRMVLLGHLLAEAALICGVVWLLGLSLAELTLPVINSAIGMQLALDYAGDAFLLAAILSCVILGAGVAALYPAQRLVKIDAIRALAPVYVSLAGRLECAARYTLVFVQFTVVSCLLTVVFGLGSQLRHMQTSDIGFSRSGLLLTVSLTSRMLDETKISDLMADWRKVPGVVSVSSGVSPGEYFRPSGLPDMTRSDKRDVVARVNVFDVGKDHLETLGLRPLVGRSLTIADMAPPPAYPEARTINVVVNRRLIETFGFSSPSEALGHSLDFEGSHFRIVGVLPDFRIDAPSRPIAAAMYQMEPETHIFYDTVIRFDGESEEVIRARLEAVWRAKRWEIPLAFRSGEEAFGVYYLEDQRLVKLLTGGALVVGLICIIGLYGLAAFSTSARTAEIGIRKAMGATRWSVVRLLLFQFLKPVLLANLIAWPVAYVVLDRWLKQFDDRVPLSLWFFLAGSGISVTIAVLTVAGLSFTAAGATPGRALRHE
ncbi:permease family protein [Asticcacaulis biprosthecium C19]|uniref:Permease family protein n=1 Tax=Asticcacaulis biprosthecium C19 TaxID=715226 RepID=F4QLN0_9CAUL|nr:permease family protein [Asticcacaulis biprosthecium C19]